MSKALYENTHKHTIFYRWPEVQLKLRALQMLRYVHKAWRTSITNPQRYIWSITGPYTDTRLGGVQLPVPSGPLAPPGGDGWSPPWSWAVCAASHWTPLAHRASLLPEYNRKRFQWTFHAFKIKHSRTNIWYSCMVKATILHGEKGISLASIMHFYKFIYSLK